MILKELIRKFAIDVFIVQKFNLANEPYHKKIEYIDNYKKYLYDEKLDFLKKDINERIYFVINSMKDSSKNKQTRLYITA